MSAFTPEPFRPNLLLRGAHAQTIVGTLARDISGVSYRRVRLDTPDGDFIDVDISEVDGVPLPPDAPIMFGLHGLEGSARGGYMNVAYRMMAQHGIRGIGMNYRSCSGEMNRTAKLYHLGSTDDVAFVHDWLDREFPGVKKVMIGFSMGANMVLKYAGERGDALKGRIEGVVSVSPPFQSGDRPQRISVEGGMCAWYRNRILKTLHAKVAQKADLIRAAGGDVEGGLASQTLRDFDNAIIAPVHGFKSAQDYYDKSATEPTLPNIAVPTLIIRSLDDPFFHPDIPRDIIRGNPCITADITDYGGHVGFLEGVPPFSQRHYAHEQALRFFKGLVPAIS